MTGNLGNLTHYTGPCKKNTSINYKLPKCLFR
uniref:Uncharacterized protein n=1 Tax=Anguilla anguilla TaxID=7936 RepID=A0A0E9VUU3_ANGAN